MAEKGFGVKEVNLIGASGTPTITSPNNINMNAVNVAISTNVSIGGTLSVTGNVSVGGTLTYEDVTNIDSVGLITARKGIVSSGVVTATAFDGGIKVVAANSVAATVYPVFAGNGATQSGTLDLKTDNSLTYNSLSGELTAVKFTGDGSSLTSLPAATPTNSDIQVVYTVTANGSSAYRFAGNGVVSTANNPDLYLIRGQKYRFINNSGGSHPFQIRLSNAGSAYSTGVTNNGASSGNIDFAPTYDSPAQLVYQCTNHGSMVGNIYLRGAAGNENNVGVTTSTNGLLIHRTTNAGPLSGGTNYDFTLPANCYKVEFVGHNISTSGSGTPAFRMGTSAGILASGHYSFGKSGTGNDYYSSRNQIDGFDTNLNAGSDTGDMFMTFSSSSSSNMWIFQGMANRRTQTGNMFIIGVVDLGGNALTTLRFYPQGTAFDTGRFSWTAYCTS